MGDDPKEVDETVGLINASVRAIALAHPPPTATIPPTPVGPSKLRTTCNQKCICADYTVDDRDNLACLTTGISCLERKLDILHKSLDRADQRMSQISEDVKTLNLSVVRPITEMAPIISALEKDMKDVVSGMTVLKAGGGAIFTGRPTQLTQTLQGGNDEYNY